MLVVIGLFLFSAPTTSTTRIETPSLTPSLTIIGGNSLIGISGHYMEEKPLYADLIDKLCECESGRNPNVINPNDKGTPSYGILQFKTTTYGNVCMKKYGFDGDIMSESNQRECAEKILEEDFNTDIWNWTNCWLKIRNGLD
jgi:hypothetical protein